MNNVVFSCGAILEDDGKTLEIYYGAFTRMVEFPCPVDARRARVRYDGAMLEMVLPKLRRRPKLSVIVSIDVP